MKRAKVYIKNDDDELYEAREEVTLVYKDIIEGKDIGESFNVPTTDIDVTINKILPKDLSSFFFFEGEKSNSVSGIIDVLCFIGSEGRQGVGYW